MKRFSTIALLLFFCSLTSWAQYSDFEKLKDKPGVVYTALDQDMLKAAYQASHPGEDMIPDIAQTDWVKMIMIDKDESKKTFRKALSILKKLHTKGFKVFSEKNTEDMQTKVYVKDAEQEKKEYIATVIDEDTMIIAMVKSTATNPDEFLKIKIN